MNRFVTSKIPSILYSVPLPSLIKPVGETPIYRHPEAVKSLPKTIRRIPHITTLQQLHDLNSKVYSDLDCLGSRVRNPDGFLGPYTFKTFNTVNKIAQQAGSAIFNLNLAPVVQAKGYADCRFVAVYAPNSEEWMTLDIACALYGVTVVPIFATLGAESLQYIFDHTNVTTIFCSGLNLDRLLREGAQGKLSKLKNIICFSEYNETQKNLANKANMQLFSWNEFLSYGKNKILDYPVVTPDTIFTVMYTSGTTGNPKGVMLTHSNFIAAYAGAEDRNGYDINAVGKGDVHLSYLTLAHVFERFFSHLLLSRGGTMGFFGGDIQKLMDDLQALKPTFMISAPRLYNRIYDNIQAMLSKEKADKFNVHEDGTLTIRDPELLQRLKNITGGRIKAYYNGSAPVDPNIARFLKTAFSAPLMEAFGGTEIAGGGFSQQSEDKTFGHIGGIFSSLEFKLVDVPDMNYTSQDKGPNGEPMPRGELCLRGAQIFKAYYKEPEKTAEAIDEQGWYHTGDIGMILPNGAVKLIDRKKNIFKLAQGEYIAPEKLENIYSVNKYVAETFVYGDPLKSYLVAIIVPDKENLMSLAKQLGLEGQTFEQLCKNKVIIDVILQELNKTGRAANLAGFEIVRNIHLETQSLALHGLMTATMKLKRSLATVHYEKIIFDLYRKDNIAFEPKGSYPPYISS